jgi:2-C-methyl-D-erythritol 4-phosphate cytidylyltransferase
MRLLETAQVNNGCEIWAVIPAAGIGKRMQSDIPKQYLMLIDRPVIEHTIDRLLAVDQVKGIVVSIRADDPHWPDVQIKSDKPVLVAAGGKERCHSVMNALDVLSKQPGYKPETTWALVHDAVRPCVSVSDIQNLINTAAGTESGGLLAMPVRDTMKRQDDHQRVKHTVDRTGLWHALTPQLFACEQLSSALESALAEGFLVTDESSAMEHAGHHPGLVRGGEDNIKITRPADLRLAELYLKSLSEMPGTGECI